jgi:hypothetical protein
LKFLCADTLPTPSTLDSADSTLPTQLAQAMPSIGRLIVAAVARASLVDDMPMACFPCSKFDMKAA